MISARIICDSVNPAGERIITYILKYPRFIHSEIMTHRMFSRNAASSRAIPILKMIFSVWNEPAMPISWGVNCKGMQAKAELTGWQRTLCIFAWLVASKFACAFSYVLFKLGAHKQIANRVTEPWAHMETLVTSTEWGNFFNLRAHPDAQPEFRELALQMLEAYVQSVPKRLGWGEWHLPFADAYLDEGITEDELIKIVSARAARTSYKNFEGNIDHQKDYELTDGLVKSKHMSPLEHAAMAGNPSEEQRSNFTGYIQYRKLISGENQKEFDPYELLRKNGRTLA